ncbi:hypothetical protein [Acidimangrovimonas pyrenivorans]|uniref:Uncharacterized protein n=1 Tax=Acidimangrovimonas pyrenivorans TaxID=2030798 RepID=A0ABV7AM29_9RHOB
MLSDPEASRTAGVIRQILPIRLVCLVSSRPEAEPQLLPESTELMPGITLGDVLVEELGIEVPYGALVLVETARSLGTGPESNPYIGCEDSQALLDIVTSFGANAALPEAGPPRAMSGERPGSGFRDRGLNDHFFRGGSRFLGEREPRSSQRAAG